MSLGVVASSTRVPAAPPPPPGSRIHVARYIRFASEDRSRIVQDTEIFIQEGTKGPLIAFKEYGGVVSPWHGRAEWLRVRGAEELELVFRYDGDVKKRMYVHRLRRHPELLHVWPGFDARMRPVQVVFQGSQVWDHARQRWIPV